MAKLNDLIGRQFQDLKVLSRAASTPDGRAQWLCQCVCGKQPVVRGKQLLQGRSKACGCLRAKKFIALITTHGHCAKKRSTTYEIWASMWARCSRSKHKHYKHYGGRGISVCEEWMRFENFLADMGERPGDLTLDRINVDGNYEPDNCRWVEWSVQVENKRNKRRGEYDVPKSI